MPHCLIPEYWWWWWWWWYSIRNNYKVNSSTVLNTSWFMMWKVSHQVQLTSGTSPTIHLQSGEKASGPLHSRSSTASPRLGTRCSICSSKTWKWSQSSGRIRSADDSTWSASNWVIKWLCNSQILFTAQHIYQVF